MQKYQFGRINFYLRSRTTIPFPVFFEPFPSCLIKNFKSLIDSAAEGGARYLIAVCVTSEMSSKKESGTSIKTLAKYYCVEVRREALVEEGELVRDNFGREEEIGGEALGLLLGEELSIIADRIFRSRIVKL